MALILGLALLAGVGAASGGGAAVDPEPLVGEGTYYAEAYGRMERIEAARIRWGQVAPCPDCRGGVALLECVHLGRRVWIVHPHDADRPGGEVVGPYLVVDCAAQADAPALRARGWVVDLPFELAARWKMRGPLRGLRVLFRPPRVRPPEPGRPHRAMLRGAVP